MPRNREDIKSVLFPEGMEVKVHFIDNKDGFRWRLESGDECSPWTSNYSGIHAYTFKNGRTFAVLTQYWEGYLPIEIPFEIVAGNLA